ncbi:BTB/POZ domain-containing protein [Dichanthelium oligosanthes]|uniref:BTB/POZ domain-containing protein n=1 Tax=Dichanthelium oligosanthes TaxID=888268 RepID=A0A1E5VQ25_9POAL|nr:BTB/POZ domain-containing protein [Dichanthelium oligosanthes]
MEDGRSICVINQYDDLGFLDLRKNAAGVRWRSRSKLTMSGKTKALSEETCHPKLATHGGQLFASTGDTISVFNGPDHVLTSTLRGSNGGGAICDFSIGGDRLFALHSEENVFDVWETPPPAII